MLRIDPKNPAWTERDIFINSRGHACEPLYVAMADLGFFPWKDLEQVEDFGSHLHGLTATTTPGIEFSTGALGTGLSLAVGAALAQRVQKRPGRVVIVTGDGELQKGLFWESAMAANHYRLDNLVVIVDRNGYQSNDRGTETVMRLEPLDARFAAFGFETRRVNGHAPEELLSALETLPLMTGHPSGIIADHGERQGRVVPGIGPHSLRSFRPRLRLQPAGESLEGTGGTRGMSTEAPTSPIKPMSLFRQIEEISLGSAANSFSELLCEHAARDPRICYVGVDTMDAEFQRRFPERAFDVGIAEQNELGIATGLARMGLIPVVQAWSPFTPLRNFEQLRTYFCRHNSKGKLITTTLGLANCSHGTTHHDLETIALYRVVPNLTVIAAMDDAQFRLAFPVAMAHFGPIALMGRRRFMRRAAKGWSRWTLRRMASFRLAKRSGCGAVAMRSSSRSGPRCVTRGRRRRRWARKASTSRSST